MAEELLQILSADLKLLDHILFYVPTSLKYTTDKLEFIYTLVKSGSAAWKGLGWETCICLQLQQE